MKSQHVDAYLKEKEKSNTWQTYLEVLEVLGHNICPHQAVVDQVATMLVVTSHPSCSCTFVEALVNVFCSKA